MVQVTVNGNPFGYLAVTPGDFLALSEVKCAGHTANFSTEEAACEAINKSGRSFTPITLAEGEPGAPHPGVGSEDDYQAALTSRRDPASDPHLLKIAKQTLGYSNSGAWIMGGMNKQAARGHIERLTGKKVDPSTFVETPMLSEASEGETLDTKMGRSGVSKILTKDPQAEKEFGAAKNELDRGKRILGEIEMSEEDQKRAKVFPPDSGGGIDLFEDYGGSTAVDMADESTPKTHKAVMAHAQKLGYRVVHDPSLGEFMVYKKGEKPGGDNTYFTSDLDDAHGTMLAMARQSGVQLSDKDDSFFDSMMKHFDNDPDYQRHRAMAAKQTAPKTEEKKPTQAEHKANFDKGLNDHMNQPKKDLGLAENQVAVSHEEGPIDGATEEYCPRCKGHGGNMGDDGGCTFCGGHGSMLKTPDGKWQDINDHRVFEFSETAVDLGDLGPGGLKKNPNAWGDPKKSWAATVNEPGQIKPHPETGEVHTVGNPAPESARPKVDVKPNLAEGGASNHVLRDEGTGSTGGYKNDHIFSDDQEAHYTDPLRQKANKNLLLYAAGRHITCPGCGNVMDWSNTVNIDHEDASGNKTGNATICGDCADKRLPGLANEFTSNGQRVDVVDGRVLAGKRSPAMAAHNYFIGAAPAINKGPAPEQYGLGLAEGQADEFSQVKPGHTISYTTRDGRTKKAKVVMTFHRPGNTGHVMTGGSNNGDYVDRENFVQNHSSGKPQGRGAGFRFSEPPADSNPSHHESQYGHCGKCKRDMTKKYKVGSYTRVVCKGCGQHGWMNEDGREAKNDDVKAESASKAKSLNQERK